MEVLLGCILIFCVLYIWAVIWVDRDLKRHKMSTQAWNSLIFLLTPLVGFWIYLWYRKHPGIVSVGTDVSDTDSVIAEDETQLLPPKETAPFRPAQRESVREEELSFLNREGEPIKARKLLDRITGAEIVKSLIYQSIRRRASDIHLEPKEKMLDVRIRVDGILTRMTEFPIKAGQSVISAVKVLAEIDIAEKRKAQDGHFRVQLSGGEDFDMRVSTAPTVFGEKVVVRILDRGAGYIILENLGFRPEDLTKFEHVIRSPHGMILATGPTGCGKTTTLYAAMSRVDATKKNIVTIEDPVEYSLPGITQIPINPRAGVTFATGLRSILRQDPDVIMVGEIRDLETAEISIRAALTGHLVFSTLHTNDAVSAIMRLRDMKIEPYLISTSLICVISQRLVRLLCNNCKGIYFPPDEVIKKLSLPRDITSVYTSKGCEECLGTGYRGRTGVFESLIVDERIKELINQNASQAAILAAARETSMRSIAEDARDKIARGITSVEEMERVMVQDAGAQT
jgi:type II secretory ATPase GspE/PulE/Tfp pilus assembly ATPase PilB-like protein